MVATNILFYLFSGKSDAKKISLKMMMRETQGQYGGSGGVNCSSQRRSVIFVDCAGLTPQSDAGLTDKAPPSSAACCRNRTPVDSLETQQQTSPRDFIHICLPACPDMANCAAHAF